MQATPGTTSILFASGKPVASGYRDITPEALHPALGRVRLVDVREPHELVGELGHIPGIERAPLVTVPAALRGWDRDEEIVLVCRSGARSGRAAETLVAAGFQRVMNLAGGMLAYGAAGYPVSRSQEASMRIEPFFDRATYTLTYVVWDARTRDAVVIDPVLDYDPASGLTTTTSIDQVAELVQREQLRVHYVLETHAHADHLSGSQLLRRRFDAKVVIGERIRVVQETFKQIFDLPASFATDGSQFDRLVADGEVVNAGALAIRVIATPGHTPACVTYQIDDALFTGDVLFMDDYGTGRCDFPRGSADAMYDSIQKLYALPDATRVFVGHDYQPEGRPVKWETTIGASKARNPQLDGKTARDRFVAMRNARDATLAAPRLLFPSVQVNVDAGRLPAPHANGHRYLVVPLNVLRPADELGGVPI